MTSLSNKIILKVFNAARRIHTICHSSYNLPHPVVNRDPAFANKTIYDLLGSDEPCITDHMSLNKK